MRIRDIQMFVAIAEQKSFTKAAEQLYIAQPALSRRINEIERKLECALFKRNTRKVELTEAGRVFYTRCKRIEREYQGLFLDLQRIKRSVSGVIRCGYTVTAGEPTHLVKALKYMADRNPQLQVVVSQGFRHALIEQLKQGELDCCYVAQDAIGSDPQLQYLPLYPLEYWLAVPKEHPLAEREVVGLEQLEGEQLIVLYAEHNENYSADVGVISRQVGFSVSEAAVAWNTDELLLYVRIGKGIGLLTGRVRESIGDIAYVRLKGNGVPERQRILAYRNGDKSPCLLAFIAAVRHSLGLHAEI